MSDINLIINAAKESRVRHDEYYKTRGKRVLIAFVGSPGSGKSTQADLLEKEISKYSNVEHINVGKRLRESVSTDVKKVMDAGDLVSNKLVEGTLADSIYEANKAEYFLLDGFFRTKKEAEWLISHQKELDIDLSVVVNIELSKEEAKKRLSKRGRSDDGLDDIDNRLSIFKTNIDEVLGYLKENGIRVDLIDGDKSPGEVFENIFTMLTDWGPLPLEWLYEYEESK